MRKLIAYLGSLIFKNAPEAKSTERHEAPSKKLVEPKRLKTGKHGSRARKATQREERRRSNRVKARKARKAQRKRKRDITNAIIALGRKHPNIDRQSDAWRQMIAGVRRRYT